MTYAVRFLGGVGVVALALAGCDGDDSGSDTMSMVTTITATAGDGGSDDVATEDGGDDGSDGADTGDGDDGMINCDSPPSHAADMQPIWDEICVTACHEEGGEWSFFMLAGDAYPNIVSVASMQAGLLNQVEPGDPDKSYMWHKLNNTHVAAGGSGLPMPKAHIGETEPDVVTPEQLTLIETWIACGAEE